MMPCFVEKSCWHFWQTYFQQNHRQRGEIKKTNKQECKVFSLKGCAKITISRNNKLELRFSKKSTKIWKKSPTCFEITCQPKWEKQDEVKGNNERKQIVL